MLKRITLSIFLLFIIMGVVKAETIPMPVGQHFFSYDPTEIPALATEPELAKPVGVGSVARGGNILNVQISFEQFSGPVDVHFSLDQPSTSPDVIQKTFSLGMHKWKDNIIGPIDESLFGDINVSDLPSGIYVIHFMVTPPNDTNNYYLYETSFVIPPKKMPVPTGQEHIIYQSTELPVVSTLPSKALPIGLGSVASSGENYTLRVGLPEFSEPVDIYLGVYKPSEDSKNVYLVGPDKELIPITLPLDLSALQVKWKENTTEAIFENLFGDVPTSTLQVGTYTYYLLVTPAGRLDTYYLWETSFSQYSLTVDSIGDGVITSNISGINCGEDCSESYLPGTIVVLTATPTSDEYLFHHWRGCDSFSDNTCTVTINGNNNVYAIFASKEVKIHESVRVLDEATMQYLMKQEGTTYYFNPQSPVISELKAGNVIVSAVNGGFMLKVTNVYLQDGLVAVETEQAVLEDVVAEGTIVFTRALANESLKSESAVEIMKAVQDWQIEIDFFPRITLDLSSGPVELSGILDSTLIMDIVIDIKWFKLKEFALILTMPIETSLSASMKAGYEYSKEKKIYTFKKDYILWVGAVPIVITPEFAVYAGFEVFVGGTIDASVNSVYTLKGGIRYQKDKGWTPVKSITKNVTHSLTVGAEASMKFYLKPEIMLKVYRIAGPYLNVEGYVKAGGGIVQDLIGGIECSTGVLNDTWYKISTGITGNIGLKTELDLKIISFQARLNYEIFNYEWILKERKIAGILQVSPSENVIYEGVCGFPHKKCSGWCLPNLAFSKHYKLKNIGAESLDWEASGGGTKWYPSMWAQGTLLPSESTSINASLLYSNIENVGVGTFVTNLIFTNTNNHLCDTTREIKLIVNPNPSASPPTSPENLIATAGYGKGFGSSIYYINLSWSKSEDNYGIAGYKLYRNPPFSEPSRDVKKTEYLDAELKSATQYCYQVTAYNICGVESQKSQEVCATTGYSCVPTLKSPVVGSLMDNGCSDDPSCLYDKLIWDFDWSNCKGATEYHLQVFRDQDNDNVPDSGELVINIVTTSSSYHYEQCDYLDDLLGWKWRVRSKGSGFWGHWSEVRKFSVEDDCLDVPF